VRAERELPVVWAVAKGSLVNKAILVPAALLISAFFPWAVAPLLMIGGAYLCYEGVEKLAHKWLDPAETEAHRTDLKRTLVDPEADFVAVEQDKIKGAIRTDFILSAEIIVIALGTVAGAAMTQRIGVLTGIAIVMTVGVYGFVAAIVKLDDLGLYLVRGRFLVQRAIGTAILRTAPWLLRLLSVAGTAAMFLVGGGLLTHGIGPLHHAVESLAASAGQGFHTLVTLLGEALVGVVAGAIVLAAVRLIVAIRTGRQERSSQHEGEGP
jgi:predicted DNA repair protein MutK